MQTKIEQLQEQNSQEPNIIAEKPQIKPKDNQKNEEKMQKGKLQKESLSEGGNKKSSSPYDIKIDRDIDWDESKSITFDLNKYYGGESEIESPGKSQIFPPGNSSKISPSIKDRRAGKLKRKAEKEL